MNPLGSNSAGSFKRSIALTLLTIGFLSTQDCNLAAAWQLPISSVQKNKSSIQEKIKKIVERRIQSDHLVGIAVCVIEKGEPLFCEAFGFAEKKTNRLLTTDTPFQLASLSKQFAATSIMLLVCEGKITLEDEIGKHLPTVPAKWKKITVRQLLAHTSGIKDYAKFPNIQKDYQKDLGRNEIAKRIYSYPLEFKPGSRFSYSNSGYTLVGYLVEAVSGQDYATFLEQKIFRPLDMKSARLEPTQNDDPSRAIGHDYVESMFVPASYNSPSWAFAAGGIVASINDLAKWDKAIDRHSLLNANQLEVLWKAQEVDGKKTGYGLGWMQRPAPGGKRFIFHQGGKPGFSTSMARLVEDRLTIVVLSNRTKGKSLQILDDIGRMLLANQTN